MTVFTGMPALGLMAAAHMMVSLGQVVHHSPLVHPEEQVSPGNPLQCHVKGQPAVRQMEVSFLSGAVWEGKSGSVCQQKQHPLSPSP